MPVPVPTDHRTPTDDGYIWPDRRDRMVDAGAIRQRMAEDIAFLVDDRGEDACIDTDDLIRMGWKPEQVRAYSLSAHSQPAAAGRSRPARRASTRSRAARTALAAGSLVGNAAAVALFAAAVLLWAGIGTGEL